MVFKTDNNKSTAGLMQIQESKHTILDMMFFRYWFSARKTSLSLVSF